MNLSKEPDDRFDREFFEESLDGILRNLGKSEAEIQAQKHRIKKERKYREKRRKKKYRDRK